MVGPGVLQFAVSAIWDPWAHGIVEEKTTSIMIIKEDSHLGQPAVFFWRSLYLQVWESHLCTFLPNDVQAPLWGHKEESTCPAAPEHITCAGQLYQPFGCHGEQDGYHSLPPGELHPSRKNGIHQRA